MPLTATRPELLHDGSDRAFRVFVHEFLAFAARLEAVRSGFAARLKLSGAAYTTLIALAHLESEHPEVGISALAAHLHVSAAFVTTEIGALVRRRLVQKRPHPRDGRRVVLGVTPRGQALLDSLLPVQAPANDALFAALDAETFRHLAALLPRMIADGDRALILLKEPPA
jgi:MarR family transcriptional regulator, organic hydroperoxide resistance regulator